MDYWCTIGTWHGTAPLCWPSCPWGKRSVVESKCGPNRLMCCVTGVKKLCCPNNLIIDPYHAMAIATNGWKIAPIAGNCVETLNLRTSNDTDQTQRPISSIHNISMILRQFPSDFWPLLLWEAHYACAKIMNEGWTLNVELEMSTQSCVTMFENKKNNVRGPFKKWNNGQNFVKGFCQSKMLFWNCDLGFTRCSMVMWLCFCKASKLQKSIPLIRE